MNSRPTWKLPVNSAKLLSLLLVLGLSSHALADGEVTFVKGDFTALKLGKGESPHALQKGDKVVSGRSYFTHDVSHAVVKLPDGTWLRIGSDTKFELREQTDHYVLRLYTGTLRLMFAPQLQKGKTRKLLLQTEDAVIETSGVKMTVTYLPLFQLTSVYVDKGLAQLQALGAAGTPELVHGGEFAEYLRTEAGPRKAREMSEEQLNQIKLLLFSQLKSESL